MNLIGKWENEYKSTMTIVTCEDGIMSGFYRSTTGATGTYKLTGVYDTIPGSTSQTVSFTVSWRPIDDQKPDESFHWCSSFAGQHRMHNGREIITSTYLLVKNTSWGDKWEDTVVDKCTFVKVGDR